MRSMSLRAPMPGRRARITVPGDKSISHRALLFAAIARGRTRIVGPNRGLDVRATARALRALGIEVRRIANGFAVTGGSFHDPSHAIDCGNSGTTMRLLMGVLAGRVNARLDGDASLRKRPMARVATPLGRMGARITMRGGRPPVRLFSLEGRLRPIRYRLPVASAQVTSAILLAALRASGASTIVQKALTRDHTQRLFAAMGARLRCTGSTILVRPGPLTAVRTLRVPGDVSSAVYLLCAAAALPGAHLIIAKAGVNPTRTAALDVLRAMGAAITIEKRRLWCNEPVADIGIEGGHGLKNVSVPAACVPNLIDEIPALCALATVARGTLCIRHAAELRVKESDRIQTTVELLRSFAADAEALDDGILVHGGTALQPPRSVSTRGDHRIGMAAAILAAASRSRITIRDSQCMATSFPGFATLWRAAF